MPEFVPAVMRRAAVPVVCHGCTASVMDPAAVERGDHGGIAVVVQAEALQ
jgi:hypothetical protein